MQRWIDGRSGAAGCVAGDMVLDHLDPSGKNITRLKGTVFASDKCILIGRVVADDSYLSAGVLHWANVSVVQHADLLRESTSSQRTLRYLFITAYPNKRHIRFWQIPADVLTRELDRRGKRGRRDVLGLHISDRNGRAMLGEEDVTDFNSEFDFEQRQSSRLTQALRQDIVRRPPKPPEKGAEPKADPDFRQFEIPLLSGQSATFRTPVPVTSQDVARMKGWLDLMSDVLVGPAK